MERTSVCRTDIMRSRVLDYQLTSTEEKITTFMKRIQEQIDCIRLGYQNASVNDPQKAENYAKKCERFLALPYFTEKEYKGKSVGAIKDDLKVQVGSIKEIVSIIDLWMEKLRAMKLEFARQATPWNQEMSQRKRSFLLREPVRAFTSEVSFLQEKYDAFFADQATLMALLEVLLNEEFMGYLGAKRAWKVSTLKEEISASICGEQANSVDGKLVGVSIELLKGLLGLKYFRLKRYLSLEVRELMKVLSIDLEMTKAIVDWISGRITLFKSYLKAAKTKKIPDDTREGIRDVLVLYDQEISFLSDMKREFEKSYSLYRFGQGLLENDIFESLYI